MSSSAAYTLLGLTAIVAGLVGILVFAVLKFLAAAKEARGTGAAGHDRTSAVADALANAAVHAHDDQSLTAQIREATAFRLRVSERVRALQEAGAVGLVPGGDARCNQAVASLGELVGRAEPAAIPVDLKTVIETAVSGYRITARARGGDVVVQGRFATIVAPADALDFALGTLIAAALEACQHAGVAPVVAVRGEMDETNRRVRVFVDDNGPGDTPMPDRDVVGHVIERADGHVDVAKSPMGGSQICLDFPIAVGARTT